MKILLVPVKSVDVAVVVSTVIVMMSESLLLPPTHSLIHFTQIQRNSFRGQGHIRKFNTSSTQTLNFLALLLLIFANLCKNSQNDILKTVKSGFDAYVTHYQMETFSCWSC